MILKKAIDAFLDRKLANTDIVKRYPDRKLAKKIKALSPAPEFVFPPFRHQQICFLLGMKFPGFFFMLDMGLGKSKISIDLFRYRKQIGEASRMLVLVPGVSNVDGWRKEIERHGPDLRVGLLDPSLNTKERESVFFHKNYDVIVCTYMGLCVLLCGRKVNPVSGRGKLALHPKKRKACLDRFDMLVCDESDYLKNHQSLIFRILKSLSSGIPYRYCLSGTPMGKDAQALWSQFFVCDKGETLGSTLGMFRECFFTMEQGYWSTTYHLQKRREKKLHRTLKHRSIRYEEHECQDLPKKIGGIQKPVFRIARMSKEQLIAHDREFDLLRKAIKGGASLQELKAPYYRLRAITSGFIPCEGKQFIDFKENPKIEALMDLLNECGDKKLIIVFTFIHTADLIIQALKQHKIKFVEVSGRSKKKKDALAKFEGPINIMLGNRAATYGLNLQCCNRMVFFETMDSIVTRKQMEKRIHRFGQNKTCYYYDIIMPGTVDDRIMAGLREGKRGFDSVIDGI